MSKRFAARVTKGIEVSTLTLADEIDDPTAFGQLNRVPVEPLKLRFLELESRGVITRGEIARRLGWYRSAPPCRRARCGTKIVDTGRVSRALGLKGGAAAQRTLNYELAVQLCELLLLDPFEAGV